MKVRSPLVRRAVASWMGITVAALLFLCPASAVALTLAPNPFPVDFSGVTGEVTLLSVGSGVPVGGTVSLGIVSPGDVTLVLQGALDPGSLGGNGLSLWLSDGASVVPFTGVGFLSGPDTDIVITGSRGGIVTFVPTALDGGTVIDPVFLSFAGPLPTDGSLSLHASFVSSGQSDGSALLVPEPASAVLVVIGLAVIGVHRIAEA